MSAIISVELFSDTCFVPALQYVPKQLFELQLQSFVRLRKIPKPSKNITMFGPAKEREGDSSLVYVIKETTSREGIIGCSSVVLPFGGG